MDQTQALYGLGAALALGLLIGLERGWKEREAKEGQRVAGLRTFGLIGLLGGVWGLLALELGELLLGVAFATLALIMVGAYVITTRHDEDIGITGIIAALLTFAFGALATLGYITIATAAAVVTTILLGLKPVLHHWLSRLQRSELDAAFKLLLISLVVLPVLPDQGYGPWEVFNPYKIWLMVVLIAGISFLGYFAMKIAGARKGLVLTGLFGGLASSTAVTLNFARLARGGGKPLINELAAGILIACATMFPRMLLVTGVFSTELARALLIPIAVMTLFSYGAAYALWRRPRPEANPHSPTLHNPGELGPALVFGALLMLILLLSKALQAGFGDTGLYLLAAAAGITDVDAINLSISNMAAEGLDLHVAALSLMIAAWSNSLFKGVLAGAIGGWGLGLRVGGVMLLVVCSGLAALMLQ